MVCELFQREQPRARFLSIGFDLKLEVTGSFTCCADTAHNQAIDLLTIANTPVYFMEQSHNWGSANYRVAVNSDLKF